MIEDGRIEIEKVLPGMEIHPLEPGSEPTFAFVLIRYKDEGGTAWAYRTTEAPNREELLGALQIQVELLRRELLEEWE